jgi:hypothetical protein
MDPQEKLLSQALSDFLQDQVWGGWVTLKSRQEQQWQHRDCLSLSPSGEGAKPAYPQVLVSLVAEIKLLCSNLIPGRDNQSIRSTKMETANQKWVV